MNRILVVDDNELGRRILQDLLESHGYQVALAKDGSEALEIARRDPPDLVISDVLMPEMDGFALCRLWNKDARLKHIPLIFYSASYTDPRDEELALNLGAARFINKSTPSEVFMRKLWEVLDEYETGRLVAPREPAVEEMVFYRKYNEALIRRLEDNMLDSERANRALERELTERKRAEEALLRERDRAKKLVDIVGAMIVALDFEGKVTLINAKTCDILGCKTEDVIGKNWFETFLPERARGHVGAAFTKLMSGEVEPMDYPENPVLTSRGEERVIAWHNTIIRDEEGKIIGSLSSGEDITERKRAEKELQDASLSLQESEARYRSVVEQSPDGIYLVDVDNRRIMESNPAFAQMLGYTSEKIRGLSIYDFVAADRQDIDQMFQSIRRGKAPLFYERQYRRKDGSLLDVWASAKTIFYGSKEVMCTIVRDLSERKKNEDALRQSEARHRAVMEQSVDAIYLADVETKCIVEANPAFAQMLGYTLKEILRLSVYAFIADKREEVDRRFQKILQEGYFSFERQYIRKNGSLLDVWATGSRISYGEKEALSVIVRDLTEKKAMEAHLLRAQRMESIGLLAGGIAHDLNNILTPILINAELLGLSLSSPASQKMLASIASNAKRGADIVRQILTFSRGAGGEHFVLSPRYLLKEIERFVKETFPKTIVIETEIPPDLWPLSGDAAQLQQVLMNLCINAKDAMSQGGTLTLSTRNFSADEAYARMHPEAKVGPYVVFSVEDTGSGIPPSRLEKIFDPFFTTKERGQGTGLGLSIVHAIVKSHGGFVRVHSEEGKGTKFLVMLPASPSAEMAEAEKEKPPLPAGNGELILVVEDEASIREITQATLETYGYRVIPAEDGSEAVALYAQHRGEIQAVITDMAMPIMDGAATIRALQKMNPAVKIIASSGMDAERMVAETPGLKVKAFLQKPFTADRLLRTLAEVLGLGSAEQ